MYKGNEHITWCTSTQVYVVKYEHGWGMTVHAPKLWISRSWCQAKSWFHHLCFQCHLFLRMACGCADNPLWARSAWTARENGWLCGSFARHGIPHWWCLPNRWCQGHRDAPQPLHCLTVQHADRRSAHDLASWWDHGLSSDQDIWKKTEQQTSRQTSSNAKFLRHTMMKIPLRLCNTKNDILR